MENILLIKQMKNQKGFEKKMFDPGERQKKKKFNIYAIGIFEEEKNDGI
jgi:hypothetical protein